MANFFSNKDRAAAAALNGSSSKAAVKEAPRQQPWVEKYRPKSLDEVTAQDHTVQVLQRTLQASNLPHMLFYGPPGTGKTSTILALARTLFGPALFSSRVLELNASDERGISIVREKVKNFARAQLSNPPVSPPDYTKTYPCPPFKIIVLDEADSMTQDAQSALRRTMETYSRITRFVLCCNYVTRIIDPLASRCSKFRFKSLDQGNAKKRLEEIAKAENVVLQPGAVEKLIEVSEGDLRRSITFLQSCARLSASASIKAEDGGDSMEVDEKSEGVTKEMVEDIAGTIPTSVIEKLVAAVSTAKSSFYEPISKIVNDMICDGWSASQTLTQLYAKIIYNDLISNPQKAKITAVFSEVDKRLVDGADEHLEVLDLALRIAGILSNK